MIRQCYLVLSKADCAFMYNMHHTLCIWGKTGQTSVHPVTGIMRQMQHCFRKTLLGAPPGVVFQCIMPKKKTLQISRSMGDRM